MRNPKRVFGLMIMVFFAAAFAGCATQSTNRSPKAYYPLITPGRTLNDAVNDLLNTLQTGKPVWVNLTAKQREAFGNVSMLPVRCTIANNKIDLLNQNDHRPITGFCFYSLTGQNIIVDVQNRPFIMLPGLVDLRFRNLDDAKKVADALYFIQQEIRGYRLRMEKQLADFEPLAAQYRALAVKPQITEEQRKLIVQANALTEQKEYFKARDKYRKALEIDPTAYPPAYYNLALLDAQMNLPFSAILYMKHYLLLAPSPKDARSAQDKIYEWELLLPDVQNAAKAGPQARGYLGVRIETPSEGATAIAEGRGVLVVEVMAGSPAEKGGIAVGDTILTIDGKKIKEARDLLSMVAATPVGKTVAVGIRRAGQDQTLNVTIAETPR